jgi:hypothetical protein
MKIKFFILFAFFSTFLFSQNPLCGNLRTDSCMLPQNKEKQEVKILEVKIKNNYQIQFIKHYPNNYLKIIVKDNLGFGQTSSLLLLSNKKQYYTKTIKLEIIDKTSAYFLLELNSNYLVTLKENGLTNIIFNEKVEFVIPKADSELIKKNANCFYDFVAPK